MFSLHISQYSMTEDRSATETRFDCAAEVLYTGLLLVGLSRLISRERYF